MAKTSKKFKKVQPEFDLSDYELNETDKKIFQIKHEYPDLTQVQIAAMLGISFEQVSKIVNKPAYKQADAEFNKDWIQKLLDARAKAADKLIEHIDNDNASISIRACEDVLQIDKIDLSQTGDEQRPY